MLKILCLYSPVPKPREWCILQQDIWYTAYTFKNVFNYEDNDIFWLCGYWLDNWTFVHSLRSFIERSYNGNFEGVPSYPDYSRFWEVIVKHKVTQFYTAPTAIRALAKRV
jgi:acetyl-CoA synthetase